MNTMDLKQVYRSRPIMADELHALRTVDELNADLRARNEARVAAIKVSMGAKYLLHPDNAPKKVAHKGVLHNA